MRMPSSSFTVRSTFCSVVSLAISPPSLSIRDSGSDGGRSAPQSSAPIGPPIPLALQTPGKMCRRTSSPVDQTFSPLERSQKSPRVRLPVPPSEMPLPSKFQRFPSVPGSRPVERTWTSPPAVVDVPPSTRSRTRREQLQSPRGGELRSRGPKGPLEGTTYFVRGDLDAVRRDLHSVRGDLRHYYGVARHLKEALAVYSAEDIEGALQS